MSDQATTDPTSPAARPPLPRENVYTCGTCGEFTVTVDIDEGVTPFTLDCRASGRVGDCPGKAYSAMYPKGPRPPHIPPPAWEWYRPGPVESLKLSTAMLEHVVAGGLLIRKMQPPPVDRAHIETLKGILDKVGPS